MQNHDRSRGILLSYSSFVALAAILVLGGVLRSPSEPGNAVLFGLSLPRLILALGLFIAFAFFAFLALRSWKNPAWAEGTLERWFGKSPLGRGTGWLAMISLGLGWIGCFLPAYRAGPLEIHWDRIRPAMVFLLLASLATLAVWIIKRSHLTLRDLKVSKTYRLSFFLFLPILLFIGVMLYSDFGVYAPEDYWYGAGVPILVTQLATAIVAGMLFLQAEIIWGSRRFDVLVFLLIWVIAAIFWAREPLDRSFLFIGPYPPNRVLYPFADAAIFDTASQFALIGQNFFIFSGQFFERALYISFLVYLHTFFGQDYGQLMAAQAALFAVFPALVYLVGRSLNSRAIGFAAAVVASFRGVNSIAASNMIDMANPKMMLTDFPTAIAVALVVLFLCEWLKRPGQKWHYSLWIGGIVGLAIMLRTNTLVLLLLVPLLAVLKFPRQWKWWLASSLLLFLAVFAMTLPWELRNRSLGGKMYEAIVAKFENVFLRRYTPPPSDSLLPQEALSLVTFKHIQALAAFYPPADGSQTDHPCSQMACFVPNHFLHNVLTSILVLPTSLTLDDLRHTVKGDTPYWRPDWDGTFTNAALFLFAVNVFFIVLGIRLAWERHRLTGLAPLAIFLFYNLANGFARTSGGRYIVPVDWILTIYFLIGLFQTILLMASALGIRRNLFSETGAADAPGRTITSNELSRAILTLAVLFGIGALIPLAENIHAERYRDLNVSKALVERESQIASAGLDFQQINAFLQNPNAEVLAGRALYPRYYIENEGEVHFYPVVKMGFPRTTFTLIGPAGEQGIILPGEKTPHFPHAVDAIVLGCREQFYVDALAVIILDETGGVYTRSPESPLQCPLKQPVCDNNHNCYIE